MNTSTSTQPAKPRSRREVREIDVVRYVKDKPMTALAIASAAGFILNGGLSSRLGRAVVGLVGPILLRTAVTSALVGAVSAYGGDTNGSHDNGRK